MPQVSFSGSIDEADETQAPTAKDYSDLLTKYKLVSKNMLILCQTVQREMQQKLAIIADLK